MMSRLTRRRDSGIRGWRSFPVAGDGVGIGDTKGLENKERRDMVLEGLGDERTAIVNIELVY